jgi:hypothetical protein
MRLLLVGLSLLACSACASSSGVFKVGPDTYGITTTAITSFGGAGKASATAIRTANDHCARQGKQALITDTEIDSQISQGSSNLTFECVPLD